MNEDIYNKVIHQIDEFNQIRITVNEFNNVAYLHIRKYYLDFEEEWLPTKDGISMPLTLNNSKELFVALIELLSLAESKAVIIENFKELMEERFK